MEMNKQDQEQDSISLLRKWLLWNTAIMP